VTHLAKPHREHATIRLGGVALVAGAAAFLAVFSFLAARFDYPAILDGTAAEVLPRLRATGATGRAVSEFLGELSVSLFFLLSALGMLARGTGFPRWMGYLGVGASIAGPVGMFRNVTVVVAPIAALNNYLLPLWMVTFGVGLLRASGSRDALPGR